MIRFVLAVFAAATVLFVWGGATQMFPWGITATQNVTTLSEEDEGFNASNPIRVKSGQLTTKEFDTRFNNRVSTYVTEKTFSWIVTQALEEDYSKYFIRELMTQLMVALFLATILWLTCEMPMPRKFLLIALVGGMAVTGTYGQLMNWWALPGPYGVGVSFNLIIGWLLAAPVISLILNHPTQPKFQTS